MSGQPSVVESPPVSTPGHPGSLNYVIGNSKAFIGSFGLKINAGTFEGKFFNLSYPDTAPAAGLEILLTFAGVAGGAVSLLDIGAGTTVGDYQLAVGFSTPSPGVTQLNCTVTSISLGSVDQECELRAVVPGTPSAWNLQLGPPGNSNFTLHYLACDPQAAFTSPAPPPATPSVFEQTGLDLTAVGAGVGSVVGTLPVTPEWQQHYVWSYSGDIAITPFSVTTETNSAEDIRMPGVYEPTSIRLKLRTVFGDPKLTQFLENNVELAAQPNLTIKARPQHVVLVLDQSGSMGSDGPPTRYQNATLAAQMFTHLFAAFREGVRPDEDKIGVVTFTDDGGWHDDTTPSPKVKAIMGLTALEQAKADIVNPAKVDFGGPDANTPIGAGMRAGLDLLDTGSASADRNLTMLVLTDGIENAGPVFVGPTDPSTPGVTIKPYKGSLNDAAHPNRDAIRDTLTASGRQFVIPLGAQVDQAVLLSLAGPNGYVPVTDPKDLAKAFGDILTFSQEVNQLSTSVTAPDPAVHFTVGPDAERVIFAVLGSFPAGHHLLVESFDAGTSTWVAQSSPVVQTIGTDSYQVAWVSKFQGVPGIPTQWRVTHLDGASPAVPVAVTAENVLVYEDLHLKADVLLDKPDYQTGDEMKLTVRIRHDDRTVLGATVHAELTAPTVGTGEALSGLGPDYVPTKHTGKDRGSPLGDMIAAIMAKNKWNHWPHDKPTGLFVDNTNELHDFDGDGNYTNTFARVWTEGSYTWNLTATGNDTNGIPFTRLLSISTFASVKVDGRATKVQLVPIPNHPSKLRAVRVIVTPQDVRHQRLGPNNDDRVFWELKDGVFENVFNKQPAPVFPDGTYQRVVLYKFGQRPTLKVEAADVLLPTIVFPLWILQLSANAS